MSELQRMSDDMLMFEHKRLTRKLSIGYLESEAGRDRLVSIEGEIERRDLDYHVPYVKASWLPGETP